MNSLMMIRPATTDDMPFIVSTWFKSQKKVSKLSPIVFDEVYEDKIKYYLNSFVTLLMVLKDDHSVIVGYINFSMRNNKAVINYVYVKRAFRGNGFASYLVSLATGGRGFLFTFDTKSKVLNGNYCNL